MKQVQEKMTADHVELMDMGTRLLWTEVISHAFRTALRKLPAPDHIYYNKRLFNKGKAIRFFSNPGGGNLPFACSILGMNVANVSRVAMEKIRKKGGEE